LVHQSLERLSSYNVTNCRANYTPTIPMWLKENFEKIYSAWNMQDNYPYAGPPISKYALFVHPWND